MPEAIFAKALNAEPDEECIRALCHELFGANLKIATLSGTYSNRSAEKKPMEKLDPESVLAIQGTVFFIMRFMRAGSNVTGSKCDSINILGWRWHKAMSFWT